MTTIKSFQQRLFAQYKDDLALPAAYNYLHGSPVQPIVPLDTAREGVMIIGAHPSARLATVGPETDVPVADIWRPFAMESYFDGQRLRLTAEGVNLYNTYLAPLELTREACWLTYLVKLYLFDHDDISKYWRLGRIWPEGETRSRFADLARQGVAWWAEELALARPRLVITLGLEVAEIVQSVSAVKAYPISLGGQVRDLSLNGTVYPVIHLADPGLLMRPSHNGATWLRRHWDDHLPEAWDNIRRLTA